MFSWGQDTWSTSAPRCAVRGYDSARYGDHHSSWYNYVGLGFRPVLEVLNPDTLDSDGLKAVTLALGGGKLGNSSEDIQIIVKNGSEFTALRPGGLTRPDGVTGSYFVWLGSDGKLYAPVPVFRRTLPSSRRSLLYQSSLPSPPAADIILTFRR